MPRALKKPEDKFKHNVICNIEDCLNRQDISKKKLQEVLSLSKPTINKYYKDPANFTLGQLMQIARLGKVTVMDLISEKTT